MTTPIIVDTSSLMEQFGSLTPEAINAMLDNVAKGLAAAYANQLELEASQSLHQTRRRYINAIKLVDSGKCEGTVMLDYSKDKLIQMLEEGSGPFDMKPYFLGSPKAKIGKNGGRYLTIPFRWGTPGIVGEADVFSGIMPKPVYDAVKSKPTTIPVSGGGTRSAGISLKEIPQQFQIKQARPAIIDQAGNTAWAAYQHKSPTFQDISKYNDPSTGQNTYRSFRRVSDKSDPDAFINPGIKAYNLMQKALGAFDVGTELGNQLDNELGKLGFL